MDTDLNSKLIEKIKILEESEARTNNKILGIHSYIISTKEIVDSLQKKRNFISSPMLIKRNIKLEFIFSCALCIIIVTPLLFIIARDPSGNIIVTAFLLILVVLLPYALYKNLTLKKFTLPIKLSDQQIEIIGEIYQWDEIENTFFVYRPGGKHRIIYFVIGFKNAEIKYFNIENQLGFRYNDHDFSEFVEYFKNEFR